MKNFLKVIGILLAMTPYFLIAGDALSKVSAGVISGTVTVLVIAFLFIMCGQQDKSSY